MGCGERSSLAKTYIPGQQGMHRGLNGHFAHSSYSYCTEIFVRPLHKLGAGRLTHSEDRSLSITHTPSPSLYGP